MGESCTCTQLTALDTSDNADGPPDWEQDPDCPTHFLWRTCSGLTGPCSNPTTHEGRHVTNTVLGVGTATVGRLCGLCSADSRDLDAEARG